MKISAVTFDWKRCDKKDNFTILKEELTYNYLKSTTPLSLKIFSSRSKVNRTSMCGNVSIICYEGIEWSPPLQYFHTSSCRSFLLNLIDSYRCFQRINERKSTNENQIGNLQISENFTMRLMCKKWLRAGTVRSLKCFLLLLLIGRVY